MEPIDILILDFNKQVESQILLDSLFEYIKFPVNIIFLDNGSLEDYSEIFLRKKLINQLIKNPKNEGLGTGTRQLFEASRNKYSLYIQNDQYLGRNFSETEIKGLINIFNLDQNIKSIALAGDVCGDSIYSERAHLINNEFYRSLEPLSEGGAGPKHNLIWREEQIQKIYKDNQYKHFIYQYPMFVDNGKRAIRQNPDGSQYIHFPDTKQLKVLVYPKEKFIYPKWSDAEWERVIKTQYWPDWEIPENELKESFHFWN